MKVSALTQDGDWRFGRKGSDYISRSRWVRQKLLTRLRSHEQDWFLDMEHGLPWLELLGQRGTREQLTSEIEEIVLSTDGVQLIQKLDVSVDGREYRARIRYQDVYGEINEVLI